MPGLGAGPDPFATGPAKLPGTTSVSCLFTWFGTKGNYASIPEKDAALKGWRRHFSTVTREGRLNIVLGTYIAAGLVGLYLYKQYKGKAETVKA